MIGRSTLSQQAFLEEKWENSNEDNKIYPPCPRKEGFTMQKTRGIFCQINQQLTGVTIIVALFE